MNEVTLPSFAWEPQDHIRDSYLEKMARSSQTPWILYEKAV